MEDRLLGPGDLPNRLIAATYLNFMQNTMGGLLDGIPSNQMHQMRFQHDAPMYFSMSVREYLHGPFEERGGPVSWPARSPGLNTLDIFLFRYLKI